MSATDSTSADAAPQGGPDRAAAVTEVLGRLRAMVLLAGSVRPTPLRTAIDRSVLDLPISTKASLLQYWDEHATALSRRRGGRESLPVRVMVDRAALPPEASNLIRLTIERDPEEFRGTGGVLRDISQVYDDQDVLLVANAAQILLEPLVNLVEAMADPAADVVLLSTAQGDPGSLMLVRCGCLRPLSAVGFVDMKEQALPKIAAKGLVRVLKWDRAPATSIRTTANYITGLRAFYQGQRHASPDPFTENWRPVFEIAEPGAHVDSSAHIHDSVILKGSRVARDAVVVRSLVCPGAVVPHNAVVVDQLVTASGR